MVADLTCTINILENKVHVQNSHQALQDIVNFQHETLPDNVFFTQK